MVQHDSNAGKAKKSNLFLRLLALLVTAALVLGALVLVVYRDRFNLDALVRWLAYRDLETSDTGEAAPFTHAGGDRMSIAYLDGAGAEVIGQIIGNALGTSGGMFCDGAKSSCAGKIAVALETAFLGYDMAKHGRHYGPYEGVVQGDAEETIAAIGRIGGQGMQETDRFILASILQGEKAQAARA